MLFLRDSEKSEIDEEEEEEISSMFDSGRRCPCCQEKVRYTEEVFLLQISQATQAMGQVTTNPIVTDEGEYAFVPLVVHFECWEMLVETIREMREDEPPAQSPSGILFCSECDSTVGAEEPFVAPYLGELHVSRRRPSGDFSDKFEKLHDMQPVCMPCIVRVIEDYLEDWEDLLEMIEFNYVDNGETE